MQAQKHVAKTLDMAIETIEDMKKMLGRDDALSFAEAAEDAKQHIDRALLDALRSVLEKPALTAEYCEITEEMLDFAASAKGGWNKEQLAVFGIGWPPPKDWKKAIIGKSVPADVYAEFFNLKR